jgi:F0F1-type ATP synthase membrane subunit c/vacuolar-type H+-ATPase subunit K
MSYLLTGITCTSLGFLLGVGATKAAQTSARDLEAGLIGFAMILIVLGIVTSYVTWAVGKVSR